MKRLVPILLVIIALMTTSCASLYTMLYAPSEIKEVKGELISTYSTKRYEVMYHDSNKFIEQENTTTVFWQYKTPDGKRHWWVNRDYREAEKTDFWIKDFTVDQVYSNFEVYEGKCENMTPRAYNYYCENPETGENFKIRRFPWDIGYGYFIALVGDGYTIIYSLGTNDTTYY